MIPVGTTVRITDPQSYFRGMRGTITASTEGIRFVQVTIAKHPPKVFLPEELEIINE